MAFLKISSEVEMVETAVIFIDIKDEYDTSSDLVCKFNVEGYEVQGGDKIAMFKVGWCHIKDYLSVEYVPMLKKCQGFYVVFEGCKLPRDETELYQFCYISNKNELYGASSTFKMISHKPTICKTFNKLYESEYHDSTINFPDLKVENQSLKEENGTLKQTLKLLVDKHFDSPKKDPNDEISRLKNIIDDLRKTLASQNIDIKLLKTKIDTVECQFKDLCSENAALKIELERLKRTVYIPQRISAEEFDISILDIPELPPFPMYRINS